MKFWIRDFIIGLGLQVRIDREEGYGNTSYKMRPTVIYSKPCIEAMLNDILCEKQVQRTLQSACNYP